MGFVSSQFQAEIVSFNGVQAGALVDIETGQCLNSWGSIYPDISRVAERHAAMFRAQLRALVEIGWNDELEDIQLVLSRQCHLLCFIPEADSLGLFLFVILDRTQADTDAVFRYMSEMASQYQLNSVEQGQLDALRDPFSGSYSVNKSSEEAGLGFRTPFMSEKAVMGLLESL